MINLLVFALTGVMFYIGYRMGRMVELRRSIALLDYMAAHINKNERDIYRKARKAAEEAVGL